MSEAAATFCVLWCVRYLLRWSDGRNPFDLALAGLALGVGFTARYEVAPAALGVAVFVAVVTGHGAAARSRLSTVLASVTIVLLPIAVSASLWALTGWVVNHELFATLSSQYGNESQVKSATERGGPLARAASADWVVIAARLSGMQPFVGIAAAGAVIYAARFDSGLRGMGPVHVGDLRVVQILSAGDSPGDLRRIGVLDTDKRHSPPVACRDECPEVRRRAVVRLDPVGVPGNRAGLA
jgi:hypothetical protein